MRFNTQDCPVVEFCKNSIDCAMKNYEYIDSFHWGDINGRFDAHELYKKGIYQLVRGGERSLAESCYFTNSNKEQEVDRTLFQLGI
jgi:hypothetical protein